MKWWAISGVVVLTLAVGVGLFARSCNADRSGAERTVEALYEALGKDDYELALSYYHPDNWAQLSHDEVLTQLKDIRSRTGPRLSGRQVGWYVVKGTDAHVELSYENHYQRVSTVEDFVLVKLDGEFRILVHNYQESGTR